MSQLALLPAPKANALREICACGHEVLHHDEKGRCTYGKGSYHGGCSCKRRKPRGRLVVVQPPELEAPVGSIVLMRPDTKRPKKMGWAIVGKTNAIVYLEQLKTKSPNVGGGGFTKRFFAMRAAEIASRRARAREGVERTTVELIHINAKGSLALRKINKIVITRVSSGTLDDDNLGGALKAIRDGVADALEINDRDFSLEGREEKKIPLHYRQTKPGKRKVCGVRIELFWDAQTAGSP